MVRSVAAALMFGLALPGLLISPAGAASAAVGGMAASAAGGVLAGSAAGGAVSASAAGGAALTVLSQEVAAERDQPQACFTFNHPLVHRADPGRVDVVRLTADGQEAKGRAHPHAVSVRDATLCVEGLEHGARYRVTLKAGLSAADGESVLAQAVTRDIVVPDRAPSLAFRGAGYILPQVGPDGLSLRSVNVARAALRVLRLNNRGLVEQVFSGHMNQTLNDRDVGSLVEKNGTLVWRGDMAIGRQRNQSVVTPFPLDAVLGRLAPGVYVAVADAVPADPADGASMTGAAAAPAPRATQWFIVSDIGLTAVSASNGLFVQVHSLRTAQPLAGVVLRAVGRDNQEVARATTAADGTARFDVAALAKAQVLFATTVGGDYSMLDLTAPGMALGGRGGGGRPLVAAADAYVYADRDIYRPGEAVRVTALLRDAAGGALAGHPLTLKVMRPDGLEVDRQTLADRGQGGYAAQVDLPGNAARGLWTVTVHTDPEGPAVGRLRFMVDDFVPPRIDLDLRADRPRIGADGALTLTVSGRTPAGAPAANLAGSLTAQVRPAATPYKEFADYHFGPVDGPAAPVVETLPGFTTDTKGAATVSLSLKDKLGGGDKLGSGRPLEVAIRAALFDVGGGANSHELVLPVDRGPYAIGIRPRFADGAVPEGAIAGFDVVAVAPDGRALDKAGLTYELYEERPDYVWFESNGTWDYKTQVHDVKLTGGTLATTGRSPGGIEVAVTSGRYRLEVSDPATGVVSALRFAAGAWVSARLAAVPDTVEMSVKGGPVAPGHPATVFVRPPYRSTVMLTVADRAVRHTLVQEIGPEGADVTVPMDADLVGGAHVLATAFAPAEHGGRGAARRAIGVVWVPVAMTARTLIPHIDGSAEVRARQQVRIPVTVAGGVPGQPVYLTLAAVDETVLDLAGDYGGDDRGPDPAAWFYGRRALGVTVRDVYGRLTAARRDGGDPDPVSPAAAATMDHADSKRLLGLPPRGTPVVALYSGILPVGADGRVSVPLSIPDFQGRLRLMVTAWSATAVGHAERTLVVRDPVMATVSLPAFLSPGDEADITIGLENAGGPRGTYTVTLLAEGGLELPGRGAAKRRAERAVARAARHARAGHEEKLPAALRETVVAFHRLGKGQRVTAVRTLAGAQVGAQAWAGRLVMTVRGPDGYSLVRDFAVPVRSALPYAILHDTATLKPGQSVALGGQMAQGLRAETVSAGVAVSALPELDVPGLLLSLDGEGGGSAQAIVSDTLPLLYYGDALRVLGAGLAPRSAGHADGGDARLRLRVDHAIDRLLSLERADGGFGLWSADAPADTWLTAYVLDFLTRARQAGYTVPDAPYRKGLDWVARTMGNNWVPPDELPGRAYALLVGARSKALDASAVRFFFQTYFAKLPSAVARAEVAAALAAVGDGGPAQDAFGRVGALTTGLRDQAMVLALMAENGVPVDRLVALARQVQALRPDPALVSAQERAWLLLAAKGLSQRAAPMALGFAGQAPAATGFVVRRLDPAGRPLVLTNGGQQAVERTVAVAGIPAPGAPPAAARHGVSVERRYLDLKGHPVDPAHVRQGDLLAVVVSGKLDAAASTDTPLQLVDPLPAGLGIETVGLGRGALPPELAAAVGELSDTLHVEARPDRYLAALDLPAGRTTFKVVYLARAEVPGHYVLPPVRVRDLVDAGHGGQGGTGTLGVQTAGAQTAAP